MTFVLCAIGPYLCIHKIYISSNNIKHEPIIQKPAFVWVSKSEFSSAETIRIILLETLYLEIQYSQQIILLLYSTP